MDPKWFPCDRCGLMSPKLDRIGDPPGRCGPCRCGMHPEDVRELAVRVEQRHRIAVALAHVRDEWAVQLKGELWGSAA